MAFSFTLVRDTFVRANSGNLGGNWTANSDATTTGTMGIVSNAAQPSVGGNAASFWNANTFAANQYAQCVFHASAFTTNTHGVGPTVRGSAGGYYRLFLNGNNVASNLSMAKVVNGVFTDLSAGGTTVTAANGDVLRLEVIGNQVTGYYNGVQKFQVTDNSLASGAPGICGFMFAASPTASATAWEGGDIVWTRKGTVIPIGQTGTAHTGNQEPCVIYEGNAQILSGNVFKIWHTDGWTSGGVSYAESTDGVSWTESGSNPVMSGACHGFVFRYNGTYYGYMSNLFVGAGSIDRWTSADGITWTKTNTGVLAPVASWEVNGLFNPYVWVEGGTWYMLYEGANASSVYSIGLATSSDGITWTKYVGNPVLTNGSGSVSGPDVHKFGNTYFMFAHTSPTGNLPSDVSLYYSTDLHTWTAATINPVAERELSDEGPNLPTAGQLADPSVIEVNGTTYLFDDATAVQASGNIHINLRTTPHSLADYLSAATGVSLGMNFFCANPNSNQWVSSGCTQVPPSPNPPTKYPVFDPLKNTWISSGNYGVTAPATVPYFSVVQNAWVSS